MMADDLRPPGYQQDLFFPPMAFKKNKTNNVMRDKAQGHASHELNLLE